MKGKILQTPPHHHFHPLHHRLNLKRIGKKEVTNVINNQKLLLFAFVDLRFNLPRRCVLCQATNLIINTLYQFYFSFLLLSRGSAANLSRDVPQKRNKKRAPYPITPRLRPPVGGLIKLSYYCGLHISNSILRRTQPADAKAAFNLTHPHLCLFIEKFLPRYFSILLLLNNQITAL